MEKREVVVDVFGPFACFTNPMFKLDRLTYDVITPSAARGILNAIYSKPVEFYYEVIRIEVMKEIKYIDIKKNEIKNGRIDANINKMKPIYRGEDATQRTNRYLKDVYYRIHANIVKQPSFVGSIDSLKNQFERRVNNGKCFYQPFFGVKECVAYFEPPNEDMAPIQVSRDFGISLYDVFDLRNNKPLTKNNKDEVLNFKCYRAIMQDGVINVPCYEDILRGCM